MDFLLPRAQAGEAASESGSHCSAPALGSFYFCLLLVRVSRETMTEIDSLCLSTRTRFFSNGHRPPLLWAAFPNLIQYVSDTQEIKLISFTNTSRRDVTCMNLPLD